MTKIIVYHSYYGCETGCCGHVIEMDDYNKFFFDHPFKENNLEFAKRLIKEELGEEHVKDLDWDNCFIIDD